MTSEITVIIKTYRCVQLHTNI